MKNAQALIVGDNLEKLINEYSDNVRVKNWKIQRGSEQERSSGVIKYDTKIKRLINSQLNLNIDKKAIVSYYDTISILKRLHDQLENVKNIEVFMEFSIPFAHQKRIDYLLAFKNTLIILEFSYFNELNENGKLKEKSEYMNVYHDKLLQAMQYEKLLKNLINDKIQIFPVVILYKPEYSKDDNIEIKENIKSNNTEIEDLAQLIKILYNKDTTASQEVKNLLGQSSQHFIEEVLTTKEDENEEKPFNNKRYYAIKNSMKK
jgi:hypothetical protein